jgi:hypothetical protein
MEPVEDNKADSEGQLSQIDSEDSQRYRNAVNPNEEQKESESAGISSLIFPTNGVCSESFNEGSQPWEDQKLDASLLEKNLKEVITRIKNPDSIALTSFHDLKHLIALSTAQVEYIKKSFSQSWLDNNSNHEQFRNIEEGLKTQTDLLKEVTSHLKATAKEFKEEYDKFSCEAKKNLDIYLKWEEMLKHTKDNIKRCDQLNLKLNENIALVNEHQKEIFQTAAKIERKYKGILLLKDEIWDIQDGIIKVKTESKQILEEIVEKWESRSDLVHAKILSQITSKLFEATECPISFELMKNPVITPSGHTVDRKAMEELIYRGFRDPFTRNGVWTSIIPNYALTEITKTVFSCWQELKSLNSQSK